MGEGRGPRWGRGAEARARARGPGLRAARPASCGLCSGLRPGLTLGFSSDMVARRRRRREAQREPVALERASHALCPAALPPQLSRGRALSLNPGAPVGRAGSRGGARARCACPAPRVRAGRPRFRTVGNASRGGSGTRARAQSPGDARPKVLGTETPTIWVQVCGATQGARAARHGSETGGVCVKTGAKETLWPNRPQCLQATSLPPTFGYFSCMQAVFGEERAKKIRLTPSGSPGRPIRGYQACFMGHTLPEQACGLEFECHRGRGSTHVWKRHPLRTRRMTSVGPECQHIFLIHLFPSDLPGGVGQPPQGHSQDGSRTYLPLPQPSLYLSTLLPYLVPK